MIAAKSLSAITCCKIMDNPNENEWINWINWPEDEFVDCEESFPVLLTSLPPRSKIFVKRRDRFHADPSKNPKTGKSITMLGPTYKKLVRLYGHPSISLPSL